MDVTIQARALIFQMYILFSDQGYDFEDLCRMRICEVFNEEDDMPSPAKKMPYA